MLYSHTHRGSGKGDYMYVENIASELDWPGEWFLDLDARRLLYCANGSAAPPSDGWVAGLLDNIVTLAGASPEAPIKDVVISGVTFEYSEPTFMRPFTVPSGGDWYDTSRFQAHH